MVYDQSKRVWKTVGRCRSSRGGTRRRPDTCRHRGSRVEATRGRRVSRFGPQNRGRGPARPGGQRTHGVIAEVASRQSGVAIPSRQSDERWKEMDKIAPVWVKWL